MAGLFGGMRVGAQMPTRGALEYRYNYARNQLIWVVAFSAINLILQLVGADLYFLFSTYVPLLLTSLGMYLCGKYPEEYYLDWGDEPFLPSVVLTVLAVIAFLSIGAYLLFWFLSKKQKVAWMIVALVFFALDTVVMFLSVEIIAEMLLDILFHAWVIYSLASGIRAAFKLKNLPPEEELPLDTASPAGQTYDFTTEE